MKLAVVTWEKTPEQEKPGDLQPYELKRVFEHVHYFYPQQVDPRDLQGFDVVQFWTGVWAGELERKQVELLDTLESPFVVMVPIGEAYIWETWQPEWLQTYLDQIWHPHVNLIGVVEENKLTYWRKMSHGKPVEYIGWPYPVEYVQNLRREPVGKRIELRTCGCIPRYLSAVLLGDYPSEDWCVHVSHNEVCSGEVGLMSRILETQVECKGGYGEWEDYLKHIAECYIGIAVDSRYTLGRYALDFVALGRPLICGNTAVNYKLFPDLVCYYYDLERQTELLHRLYYDEDFYGHCVTTARAALKDYTYAVCRMTYLAAIERAKAPSIAQSPPTESV